MTSLLIKQLLLKIINERLINLETRGIVEMNQLKAFNIQMNNQNKLLKTLAIKPKAKVIQVQPKKMTKPIITRVMTMKTLKHDNTKQLKLIPFNKNITSNKHNEIRTYSSIKKRYIARKDAEFNEIVKMHMINFDSINEEKNDCFYSKDLKRTIEDSKLTINISIIDDDVNCSTNYLDQNEVDLLKTLEAM